MLIYRVPVYSIPTTSLSQVNNVLSSCLAVNIMTYFCIFFILRLLRATAPEQDEYPR